MTIHLIRTAFERARGVAEAARAAIARDPADRARDAIVSAGVALLSD